MKTGEIYVDNSHKEKNGLEILFSSLDHGKI